MPNFENISVRDQEVIVVGSGIRHRLLNQWRRSITRRKANSCCWCSNSSLSTHLHASLREPQMAMNRRPHSVCANRISSSASSLAFTAVQSPLMFASILRSSIVAAQAERKIKTASSKVRILNSSELSVMGSLTLFRWLPRPIGCFLTGSEVTPAYSTRMPPDPVSIANSSPPPRTSPLMCRLEILPCTVSG